MGMPAPPPAPPYEKLLAFAERQAEKNNALTEEFLSFTKEAFAKQDARADQFYEIQRPEMEAAARFSQEQRERYRQMGMPLEDELATKLKQWSSPERTEQEVAAAVGDVTAATEAERRNLYSRLADMGVDPSQVAATGLDKRISAITAAQKAAAATGARRATEAVGLDRLASAANIYRGLPQVAAEAAQSSVMTGAAGLDASGAAKQFGQRGYAQGSDMLANSTGKLNSAYGVASDIYKGQLSAYDMQLRNSPWNVAAGLLGMGLGRFGFAEGIPVIPSTMSPSRGVVPDDIPAAVSAGEAVLDRDTVAWHGVKTISKMMQEAKQGMRGLPAEKKVPAR
jgi:hemerythrin superfamily protein